VDIVGGGAVSLLSTVVADDNQTITLGGGTLRSLASLPNFAASIQLNSGIISIAGGADLGTGTITVQVTAERSAAISTTATAKAPASIGNALKLNGGTLTLRGALTLTGPVTLNSGTLDTEGQLTIAGPSTLTINGGTFGTKGTTVVSAPVTLNHGGTARATVLSASATYEFTGTVTIDTAQLFLVGRDIFTGTLTLTQSTNFVLATTHATIVGPVTGGQTLTLSALTQGLFLLSRNNFGTTQLIAGSGMTIKLLKGFTGNASSIGTAGDPLGIVLDERTPPH